MTDKKIDIAMFNAFKTYDEAEAYRHKLQDPDDYGIISMIGRESEELHTIALKSALLQIEKAYDIV